MQQTGQAVSFNSVSGASVQIAEARKLPAMRFRLPDS